MELLKIKSDLLFLKDIKEGRIKIEFGSNEAIRMNSIEKNILSINRDELIEEREDEINNKRCILKCLEAELEELREIKEKYKK